MDHENMDGQSSFGGLLLTFLAGLAVGAAAATLYAPQSGVNTRAQIADKTNEMKGRIGEVSGQVAQKAGEIKERIVTTARESMEHGAHALDSAAKSMDATARSMPPSGSPAA